jgi:hypothetical protein
MTFDRKADARLRAALANAEIRLAVKGLPVFPCRERAKEPLTRHGCKEATTDFCLIRRWRKKWPRANIGIACGGAARLLVVDVTVMSAKARSAASRWCKAPCPKPWRSSHQAAAATCTSATPQAPPSAAPPAPWPKASIPAAPAAMC